MKRVLLFTKGTPIEDITLDSICSKIAELVGMKWDSENALLYFDDDNTCGYKASFKDTTKTTLYFEGYCDGKVLSANNISGRAQISFSFTSETLGYNYYCNYWTNESGDCAFGIANQTNSYHTVYCATSMSKSMDTEETKRLFMVTNRVSNSSNFMMFGNQIGTQYVSYPSSGRSDAIVAMVPVFLDTYIADYFNFAVYCPSFNGGDSREIVADGKYYVIFAADSSTPRIAFEYTP